MGTNHTVEGCIDGDGGALWDRQCQGLRYRKGEWASNATPHSRYRQGHAIMSNRIAKENEHIAVISLDFPS